MRSRAAGLEWVWRTKSIFLRVSLDTTINRYYCSRLPKFNTWDASLESWLLSNSKCYRESVFNYGGDIFPGVSSGKTCFFSKRVGFLIFSCLRLFHSKGLLVVCQYATLPPDMLE